MRHAGLAAGRRPRRMSLLRGGTDGNEQLTALTGTTLLVLFAAVGITILRIGQLISEHLFIGLLLLGPVSLKMASTGYRFMRYYTRDSAYYEKGPPPLALRLVAPAVVLCTIAVFVSGIVLLFEGPANRGSLVLIHKVSFIAWLAFTALHVLGHLPGLPKSFRGGAALDDAVGIPGTGGRWLALGGAIVAGVVLAIVLIPDYGAWTASGALHHHHHLH